MAIPMQPTLRTPRPWDRRRWRAAYYQFFLLQCIHIGSLWYLKSSEPDAILLFLSGTLNILLYGRLLWDDVRSGRDDIAPFWFYLGMSLLRLGVGTLYTGGVVLTGDLRVLQLGRLDATAWLMDGHLLLLVCDFCLIAGYFLVQNISPHRNLNQGFSKLEGGAIVYRTGLAMAAFGFMLRFAQAQLPLGGLGQIVGYLADFGVPAGVLLMFLSCIRRRVSLAHPDLLVAVGLQVLAVVAGLSSFMKSDLLISLLPVIFVTIDLMRLHARSAARPLRFRTRYLLLLAFFAYFFLFTVSGYSDLRRAGYWANMSRSEFQITADAAPDVLPDLATALHASIPGTAAFRKLHQYPDRGVWHLLNRLSATSWAATAMRIVHFSGTRTDSMIGALLLSVTPRLFFPDKPQIVWGREVAVVLGQARSVETATTATALSLAGYFYWWGGYWRLILMATLSGAGFAFVYQRFRPHWRTNPIAALAIFVLAWNALHWKESDVLGGFQEYLYLLIIFLPMSLFIEALYRHRTRTRPPVSTLPAQKRLPI